MAKKNHLDSNILNKDILKLNTKDFNYSHIINQYKLYIEMTNCISERRDKTNNFFLTLNTLIIGILGFFYDQIPLFTPRWLIIFPALLIIILSIIWFLLILNYRNLNSAKYKVICEFEKNLPTTPWSTEWYLLGEGKEHKNYVPLTEIEKFIPLVFICLYICTTLFYIIN